MIPSDDAQKLLSISSKDRNDDLQHKIDKLSDQMSAIQVAYFVYQDIARFAEFKPNRY